ncbi:YheC/YheD family endospore coat-associated protein [Falsibacillus albus]|uniref:Glutathione synthetase n=1 Tax=Falsibacillus albus TaxID=2478915 RepID=A0A3L7K2J5_9BACI|nr:YheC/YheD family protein [Falsibacillus albus]RLQ97317.1 glutathione synthetase [Falsibacillus albus]
MNIYYSEKEHIFFHNDEDTFVWGAKDDLLPQMNETSSKRFFLNVADKKVGPLIGILTSKNKKGVLTGNSLLFQKIQAKLQKSGGLSFIFTLEDTYKDRIEGYFYDEPSSRWYRGLFPLPQVVYNRIPFRWAENRDEFNRFKMFLAEQNIPFFNPGFIHKFSLYEVLKKHPSIALHLPETSPSTKGRLEEMLSRHKSIYVKPVKLSQGKGISRISLEKGGDAISYETMEGTKRYATLEDFWTSESPKWKNDDILLQQEITTKTIDGKKYDLRGLVHYSSFGYSLTGIGIRVAGSNKLTTHLKRGGSLFPYEKLKDDAIEDKLSELMKRCGEALTDHYGFFGEFSFDVGIDQEGHIWIFEINSKPMSFDEPLIEQAKIENLIDLFLLIS